MPHASWIQCIIKATWDNCIGKHPYSARSKCERPDQSPLWGELRRVVQFQVIAAYTKTLNATGHHWTSGDTTHAVWPWALKDEDFRTLPSVLFQPGPCTSISPKIINLKKKSHCLIYCIFSIPNREKSLSSIVVVFMFSLLQMWRVHCAHVLLFGAPFWGPLSHCGNNVDSAIMARMQRCAQTASRYISVCLAGGLGGCLTVALWGCRSTLNVWDDEISKRFRIPRPLNSSHMSQAYAV